MRVFGLSTNFASDNGFVWNSSRLQIIVSIVRNYTHGKRAIDGDSYDD
ncbi:hypothetical protein [Desulfitobacterium dichloroeliminans]|nr:hypothetical protein [Desulfitobacterium dichloroeliminans]